MKDLSSVKCENVCDSDESSPNSLFSPHLMVFFHICVISSSFLNHRYILFIYLLDLLFSRFQSQQVQAVNHPELSGFLLMILRIWFSDLQDQIFCFCHHKFIKCFCFLYLGSSSPDPDSRQDQRKVWGGLSHSIWFGHLAPSRGQNLNDIITLISFKWFLAHRDHIHATANRNSRFMI